ncbi:NAD(P)/FAD-dependent oxidoreductase [Fournierella massiliensis]|uniref:NAD(P)/FAD-dependent oxidoreductase n=1 Tax=Allofournierella massiliensis TaxID=1650663 RepID=UPI003520CCC3
MVDVAIIGCGVTGAAVAYQLAKKQVSVLILEAENDVSMGTTKANSAILHAGYDPEPGTSMARLNVRGSALAKEICAALDVPYKQTGSFVVAFGPEQEKTLQRLYENGAANGVPGLEILSGDEARALEPNLSPEITAALHAPSAAIVSPWEFALAMAENAVQNGADLHLETRVTGLAPTEGGWKIATTKGDFEARFVVNAAGVDAGKVHAMAAPENFVTRPCRGEYYLLDKSAGSTVGRVIFQCPTAAGKGVLVAPTVHGNLIVGPNAQDVADSADTATTAMGLAQVAQSARKSVPGVDLSACIRNFAGIRANTDRPDFVIQWAAPGFLDLAGMKSPGLSAAAAVGEEAAALLQRAGLVLKEKENPVTTRKRIRFKELPGEEKAALIAREPSYGRVICRCERVTEGEIIAACHTAIPPRSIDGVKRRVGAGMGRCQGGFCGPRVMEILSRELGKSPLEIPQEAAGSILLTGRTKQAKGDKTV